MNKVFLIGRLTKEPELRHTYNGTPVCQINIAVDRSKQKDKDKETDFINVLIWDKQAENIAKYQTKGNLIAIEGKIQISRYNDKDNNVVFKTEIIATGVQYLENIKKETKKVGEVMTVETIAAEELDDLPLPF